MPPDQPLILGFDTSAAQCAAALVKGGKVLARQCEPMLKGQAERLMPLLEEVLANGGKTWADIDAIAVGTGPGNFTGTRLSVSAARGLALALGRPALGVTAFEVLAFGTGGRVMVTLDARQNRYYVQTYYDGKPVEEPRQVAADEIAGLTLLPDTVVLGHHADEIAFATGAIAGSTACEIDAATIAQCASRHLGTTQPRPAPLYLRPADAALPSDPPPVIFDVA